MATIEFFLTIIILLVVCAIYNDEEDDDTEVEIEAEEQPRHLSHPHRRYLRKKSRRLKL